MGHLLARIWQLLSLQSIYIILKFLEFLTNSGLLYVRVIHYDVHQQVLNTQNF